MAYQSKNSFNRKPNKQSQEFFSSQMLKSSHLEVCFKNVLVFCVNFQKHLGVFLDEKLNFNYILRKKGQINERN